jgi:hypothetical protein
MKKITSVLHVFCTQRFIGRSAKVFTPPYLTMPIKTHLNELKKNLPIKNIIEL